MVEKLTQKEKYKILDEVFSFEKSANELRQISAEDMVANGIAKSFRDACEILKKEEDASRLNKKRKPHTLSVQEIDLKNALNDR